MRSRSGRLYGAPGGFSFRTFIRRKIPVLLHHTFHHTYWTVTKSPMAGFYTTTPLNSYSTNSNSLRKRMVLKRQEYFLQSAALLSRFRDLSESTASSPSVPVK